MKRWSRRGVLGAAIAVVAGMPFGLRGCADSDPSLALDAALSDWFAADAAQAVGRRVLALGDGWNTAQDLRGGLLARLAGGAGGESPAGTRQALTDAIRDDFRRDRVVSVEGWLLAETEARLYGLAVLRAAANPPERRAP